MRKRTLGTVTAVVLGLFTLNSDAGEPAKAVFVGAKSWIADGVDKSDFGGLSALELDDTGTSFVALTDKGRVTKGRFVRDTAGRVKTIERQVLQKLQGLDGPLGDRQRDSEGLALAPDGGFYVSFESANRVLAYSEDGTASAVPVPEVFKSLQHNSGLEALAIDKNGHLFAMPERSGKLNRPFPIWRFDGQRWDLAFEITRSGGFLPVGADFGPDGKLYVLERGFSGFAFQSRIRSFDPDQTGVLKGSTIMQSNSGAHDNLEGIAVWQDAKGGLRLTLVSDNNFNSYLRTEIVEYRLTE